MALTSKQMKELTGANTKMEAITILYKRLEARKWSRNGFTVSLAGYDAKNDLVHFCDTRVIPGFDGVYHERFYLDMETAIDCISGKITA